MFLLKMNWGFCIFSLALLLCCNSVNAQIIERGPYLQKLSSESVNLKWRTDSATDSKVWYGDDPGNLSFSIFSPDSIFNHEVIVDGLLSNTTYYYAIGNGSGQLAGGDTSHYFITSPTSSNAQTIRAVILGDAGTANDNQRAVRDAFYNYLGGEHIDMMMLLGDNAYEDGKDYEYQLALFENMYEDRLINSALWPTFGNHDGRSSLSVTQTGPYYDIFTLPKNAEAGGLASGTEAYYSFDYGNVHVVCLNSDDIDRSPEGEMLQWLETDLNATNKDWKIVMFHHAPYTGDNGNESDFSQRATEMRENAVPIIEAAGVDLVLCGHTHAYQRSYFINGHYDDSSTWDPDSMGVDLGDGRVDGDGPYLKDLGVPGGDIGTVYVVAGNAGKTNPSDYNYPAMFHSVEKLGSVILEINDFQMDVKFIDADSLVEDYFTILKQGDPPSVTITNPENNNYYDNPQLITIAADASDNGEITQVEFLVNNVSIGIDNSAPYEIDWSIPAEGLYVLKAIATDDENNIAFSMVNIQVGPSMVCQKIIDGSDDAEEKTNGSVSTTSGDLELIRDGSSDQTVGLRFTNLDIPQCAVINEAYIQFTVDENSNINPCALQIFGEADDDALEFSSNTNNLTNRTKTVAYVEWSPEDWINVGDSGPAQKTVNIASVVQEIVDRVGFTSNSSIVILIEGNGKRVAESFSGGNAVAPEICIDFIPFGPDDDGDGTCNANDVCPNGPEPGTSCDDGDFGTYNDIIDANCNCVGIPYDCPIFPANIGDLCDDGDPGTYDDTIDSLCNCIGIPYDCPSLQLNIGDLCDDGDAGTYNDSIDSNCICIGTSYDCPSLQANIGDACDDGNPNTANDTIDINCNCGGIIYDCPLVPGNIGEPCDDGNPNSINDVIDDQCICQGVIISNQSISNDDDDAEEDPNGSVSLTSSDLEMVIDGGDNQVIGLRFQNMDIPKEAEILSAYIQFTVDQTDNENPSNLEIFGEAVDDAFIFENTTGNISVRPKTSASVFWSPLDWLTVGEAGLDQQTADISAIIQEIVNRDGYSINSSIALIIEGVGKRTAVSYDGNANDAPELIVTFKCLDNDNNGVCDSCPNGAIPGALCDDGDPTTYNDVFDLNCNCVGIPYDCPSFPGNIGDPCDDGNPNTSNDLITSNCECIGSYDCPSIPANIGDPCDDGNPNTLNDEIDTNCNCVGTAYDCPAIPGNIGDPCDDGNPNTLNDEIDANCNCVGIPYDCPSIPANIGDSCDDGNPNTLNDEIDANCNCVGSYDCPSIPANIGDPCDDGNPNTLNDEIDSNCNCVGTYDCPSIPANIGDPCDDGDSGTYNDLVDSNCNCTGTPYDCPSIPANIGDPCDDGNPNTSNDEITASCECIGSYDCPSIPANIGDPCNDGDASTYDDTVDSNCNCVGIPYDCPTFPANIGDPCNDGNPGTSNDMITSNCECMGTYDCPSIPGNIGDPCDDGNPGTFNDTIDSNCNCIGIPYDCPSIPGNIGDPCDDGNPNSINDVIDANCFCLGSITTTAQINSGSDDAEEEINGNVSLTSSDLEMVVDGSTIQSIGLRFTNLNIPQGAQIDFAFIQFTTDQTDNINPSNLDIYGEAIDDAPTFSNTIFDISSRQKTIVTVSWTPANWQSVGEAGPDQQTANIASIVQEIVNRDGYTENSAIAFIIEGEGKRTADSYDGNPSGAPELIIFYKCSDENNDGICDECPGGGQPGELCDDGNPGTYNDVVDSNCNCAGTPYDCPTFPANLGDPCDDGNSETSNDVITSNCECLGVYDCPSIPANIGDPCDDGNPETSNDVITSNCECLGTYDCPSIPANIGDVCDDGDSETYDDIVDANCNCVGTPYDCPTFPANIGDPCDDGNSETSNDVITSNCECLGVYDCPSIPGNIGDPCDDGNPETSNDIITSNCECIGTYDCPSIPGNIGDPCDDGDPSTFNDAIDSNCECVGSLFECPSIPGNIGDPCDDGDPNTSNDMIDSNCNCLGSVTTIASVNKNSDDAEEDDGGAVNLQSSDLEMIVDGSANQTIGLRFENLNIPQGATIESAYIQFAADQVDNINPCDLDIFGQAADDPITFLNTTNNISNRIKTAAFITWSPENWVGVGDAGPAQQTDDISIIIQEIVDQNGFSTNSSIVIMIEGVGKRTAESFEGDPSGAAKLVITYRCNDSNNDGYCDSCPGGIEPGDPCDDGDASTYNDLIDSNCDCTGIPYDCPSIQANIGDLCDDGDSGTHDDTVSPSCICEGIPYDCPGIQANIGDLCDDGDSGTYDDMVSPSCICEGISYDCPSIQANFGDACDDGDPNTVNDVIDSNCACNGTPQASNVSCAEINSSTDDAEEKANGNINLTSSDLEMIVDGGTTQTIGLRFNSLNIPQYATINSADIQFTADQTDNINPCNLQIYGEASDDALTFNGNFDISSRPKTTATEAWSPADWLNVGDAGPAQKTVDIASILQEIVDRAGYTSNSSIVIIIEGVGKRTAESFNASQSLAPEICVEYFDPPQSLNGDPIGNLIESETVEENLSNVEDTDNSIFSTIQIYPNPAVDRLIISFEAEEQDFVNVQIMDISGQKLVTDKRKVDPGINKIELENLDLETGIYFIQCYFEERVYTSKFSIIR